MTPHICKVKHDPPNSWGDCLRACVASILDVPEVERVPHFVFDGNDEQGVIRFKDYLRQLHHVRPFYMGIGGELDDVFRMMAEVNRDIEYLLFCRCGGGDHVVVCKNDKVIHDPAWYKQAITGPCESAGGLWVIVVLVRA